MNSVAVGPDPSFWTVDWMAGTLRAKPESCPHFSGSRRPIFDLASLTKIVVTTTLVSDRFVKDSKSRQEFFEQRLVTWVPELVNTALKDTTIGELWEHRSGLQAHRLLFSPSRKALYSAATRADMWAHFIKEVSLEKLTIPKATIYSDLSFILLGLWLERSKQDQPLEDQFYAWKKDHGLDVRAPTLRFGVSAENLDRVPPTESRHPAAEVNDDNCYSMGSVSSHAGLFGSVEDLWAFVETLFEWNLRTPKLSRELHTPRPGIERFSAGWDTPSSDPSLPSQAGRGAKFGTIGHLGFTGTALWWNPQTAQAGILLSNRVRPADSMQSRALIRVLRQEFFQELWHNGSLGGESWKTVLNQPLAKGPL